MPNAPWAYHTTCLPLQCSPTAGPPFAAAPAASASAWTPYRWGPHAGTPSGGGGWGQQQQRRLERLACSGATTGDALAGSLQEGHYAERAHQLLPLHPHVHRLQQGMRATCLVTRRRHRAAGVAAAAVRRRVPTMAPGRLSAEIWRAAVYPEILRGTNGAAGSRAGRRAGGRELARRWSAPEQLGVTV